MYQMITSLVSIKDLDARLTLNIGLEEGDENGKVLWEKTSEIPQNSLSAFQKERVDWETESGKTDFASDTFGWNNCYCCFNMYVAFEYWDIFYDFIFISYNLIYKNAWFLHV